MGANFVELRFPVFRTKQELTDRFIEAQEQDRYENGHSYSGGIGMARGLKILEDTYATEAKAYEFLVANCKKWEEAQAVRYLDENKKWWWLVGARCSS